MTFPFKDALGYQLIISVWCLVLVFCIVHILYCTNTLHVPLITEHLAIASEECSVCWLVLPFRQRNNFTQLSKHISLYCIYRFSTHELCSFHKFSLRFILKLFLKFRNFSLDMKYIFLKKRKSVLVNHNQNN